MTQDEQPPRRRPGRPATGQTPKRNVRIGATWDEAAELARAAGVSMTAYVEAALRAENARARRARRRSGHESRGNRRHPTCIDVSTASEGPGSAYLCGPDCPTE